jgi:hypothetical protein
METGKVHLIKQMPSLINNETVKDPKNVAYTCNSFSLTIAESINLHKEEEQDAISFLKNSFPIKFPGIKTIPIL